MSDPKGRPPPGMVRTSLVDRGWDEVPDAVPHDAVVDPTIDSKELTQPDPSRRPAQVANGPSALGLAPPSVPSPGSARPAAPPPPSRRSQPPPPPSRRSQPPPPPSRRSEPPKQADRPVAVSPILAAESPPAPPAPTVDTVSASLGSLMVDAVPPSSQPPPPMSAVSPPASLAAPPSAAGQAMPTLLEVLGQRVQFGQGSGPLWGFGVVAMILVACVVAFSSGSCTAMIARLTASSPRPIAAASAVAKSASVAAPVAPPPEPASTERAKVNVAEIEARPQAERSVADVIALANDKADGKRRTLEELGSKARSDGAFAASSELGAKLRAALSDADTSRDALRVMAELPGGRGPDLLFFVWSTRRKGDPLAELALSLLETKEVRTRASQELAIALELRAADGCDAAKPVVERALEHGDRRSASALARFSAKTGCGDKKKDDCFACLRDGDLLKNAAKAVAKRAPPKL